MTGGGLIAFLRARLEEDEAVAREADATVLPGDLPRETHIVYGLKDAGFGNAYQGFVLVHDPARVLREVEAKRAILELHREVPAHDIDWSSCAECRTQTYPCGTLRQIASVYSDHPGYQAEWKL